MKLSIIVPVYNAEKWLRRCVNSLLNQGIGTSGYEILLIDDGSKDGSLAIAKDLAAVNSNIRVFTQPNAGPGAARNRGIDNAKGQYLMFVDADDTILEHSLTEVITMATENDCDICFYRLHVYYDESGHYYSSGCNNFTGILTGENAILRRHTQFSSACTSLFKKQFISVNDISFGNLHYGEDSLFMAKALSLAKRVMNSGIELYNYEFSKTPDKFEMAKAEETKLIDNITLAEGILDIAHLCELSSILKQHLRKHANSIVIAQMIKFITSFMNLSSSSKQKFIRNLCDSKLIPLKGTTLSWKTSFLIPLCNCALFMLRHRRTTFSN